SQWSGQSAGVTFDYLIPDKAGKVGLPGAELTLIDPACGSGHFLLRAFDHFLQMYESEGWSRKEAAASILKRNLFGVDIDPVALWITALALMLKCMRLGTVFDGMNLNLAHVQIKRNGDSEQSLLGTLSPHWTAQTGHPLSLRFNAVVTNPPYIGRK